MESCNCDYHNPIFTNPQAEATHDHCTALMVYRIDRGRHGDVTLDNLKFALVIRSRRIMSDGGWIFGCVVDETASEAQRQALGGIVSGKAGGPPQMIRDNLVSDFRGVEFRKIDFTADGLPRHRDPRHPPSPSKAWPHAIVPASRSHRQHRPSGNRRLAGPRQQDH